MRLIPVIALVTLAAPLMAQNAGPAQVFSSQRMGIQLKALDLQAGATHASSLTLGDYKSHILMLTVKTATGEAELHEHYNDIFVITGGNATLVTGGSLVSPHTVGEGEMKGSSIRGGARNFVHRGDVVHIPAGMPHRFLIPPGVTFTALVVKVRR